MIVSPPVVKQSLIATLGVDVWSARQGGTLTMLVSPTLASVSSVGSAAGKEGDGGDRDEIDCLRRLLPGGAHQGVRRRVASGHS